MALGVRYVHIVEDDAGIARVRIQEVLMVWVYRASSSTSGEWTGQCLDCGKGADRYWLRTSRPCLLSRVGSCTIEKLIGNSCPEVISGAASQLSTVCTGSLSALGQRGQPTVSIPVRAIDELAGRQGT